MGREVPFAEGNSNLEYYVIDPVRFVLTTGVAIAPSGIIS